MNVKTLILGVVMGGMIAAGTYFFLPTPSGASAKTMSQELQEAVGELKRHRCMIELDLQPGTGTIPGVGLVGPVAWLKYCLEL